MREREELSPVLSENQENGAPGMAQVTRIHDEEVSGKIHAIGKLFVKVLPK